MSIDISPQTLEYVNQQVALGQFESPAAMIEAAVNSFRERQAELQALIQEGLDASARGDSRPLDIERIKQLGREFLNSRQQSA
jgi:Arc/MetJ-type ribon-helix-helix transcriptional regulator